MGFLKMDTGSVRREWVRDTLLPFAASLALHSAIIVIAVQAARAVQVVLRGTESQSAAAQTDLASRDLLTPVSLHGVRGRGEDPFLRNAQDQDPAAGQDTIGWTSVRGGDLSSIADNDAAEGEARASIIGIGPDATFARGGTRIGDHAAGGAGPIAPFGSPSMGGTPDGGIFGGGNLRGARSVAYVCDASGSMINHFAALRHEIERSVLRLKAVQAFNIVFFQEDRAASLEKGGLVLATGANKDRASEFLSRVTPAGTTDPLPALALALRQGPDLIWLLTDGDFPDNDTVLKFIRANNPDGRVQINTIAFVARGEGYERVLRTIARENRGEFRYVDERELR